MSVRRLSVPAALIGLGVWVNPADAGPPPRISVGIGIGGPAPYYRPYHGPSFGFYYAPRPVYYPPPVYVVPAPTRVVVPAPATTAVVVPAQPSYQPPPGYRLVPDTGYQPPPGYRLVPDTPPATPAPAPQPQ